MEAIQKVLSKKDHHQGTMGQIHPCAGARTDSLHFPTLRASRSWLDPRHRGGQPFSCLCCDSPMGHSRNVESPEPRTILATPSPSSPCPGLPGMSLCIGCCGDSSAPGVLTPAPWVGRFLYLRYSPFALAKLQYLSSLVLYIKECAWKII